jgi:hypothetical protein
MYTYIHRCIHAYTLSLYLHELFGFFFLWALRSCIHIYTQIHTCIHAYTLSLYLHELFGFFFLWAQRCNLGLLFLSLFILDQPVCTHVRMWAYIYIYTHTIYIYIYIYNYMHTYMCKVYNKRCNLGLLIFSLFILKQRVCTHVRMWVYHTYIYIHTYIKNIHE